MCKYSTSSMKSDIRETENTEDDIDLVKEMMRRERSANLVCDLINIFKSDILSISKKALELEPESEMLLEDRILDVIISDIIRLGEKEPYGVLGGIIVVHFVRGSGDVKRIGKFAINSNTIPTFELHLRLASSTNLLHKMSNLMKRMQARPPLLFVDEKFQLDKVKLYRF